MIKYNNPTPVAVVLVPVYKLYNTYSADNGLISSNKGLLLIRRNIEPKKGKLALPGGFVNEGENIETAALRELEEETGIVYDPLQTIKLWESRITPNNQVLAFCIADAIPIETVKNLKLNDEVSEFVVSTTNLADINDSEFAFPLHLEMIKKYIQLSNWNQI